MSTLSVTTLQGLASSPTPTTIEVQSGHKLSGAAGSITTPGMILQVVQTHVTAYSTTSSSSNSSTGLTVTITPKFSSSKVLITGNMNSCHSNAATRYARYELFKGGSFLVYIHALVGYLQNDVGYNTDFSYSYLDSPNTTSATTYDLQWSAHNGGSSHFNNYGSSNNTTRSTITAYEIAG